MSYYGYYQQQFMQPEQSQWTAVRSQNLINQYYIPVPVPVQVRSYSDPIPRKYNFQTESNNNYYLSTPIISKARNTNYDQENFQTIGTNAVNEEINPYRIMICGSKKCNPDFIKRFMNQIKNLTIVTGSSVGVEEAVNTQAIENGLVVRRNINYNNEKDNSLRLYGIYSQEKPFKIYIIDDDYEGNLESYKFTKYLPNAVDIVVVKSHYYY